MQHPPPPLTGTYHHQNYVWAIAMNLAWNELVASQLGGEARVETDNEDAKKLVNRLITGVFNHGLLEKAAYFIRSGIGPEAVTDARADLLHEKNVAKSLLDSIEVLPGELFSYARVEKVLKWYADFEKCIGIFQDQKVEAFQPAHNGIRGIDVLEYKHEEPGKSIVRLLSDGGNDQVYIMGGYEPGREAEMVARISTNDWPLKEDLKALDTLIIPSVDLSVSHIYPEMIGQQLLNPRLPNVFIGEMKEEIKFAMNHEGVKFTAEALVEMFRGMPPQPKTIVFDQPFLIVLKETDRRLPYLVIGVNNATILEKTSARGRVGEQIPV